MNQEIAEAILRWEDHDDVEHFAEVTVERIVDKSRWSTFYIRVYQDERDDTYWMLTWSRGSTEQQDEGPENIEFVEVKPVEKTIIDYVPVKS